jgi:hypothetical protein
MRLSSIDASVTSLSGRYSNNRDTGTRELSARNTCVPQVCAFIFLHIRDRNRATYSQRSCTIGVFSGLLLLTKLLMLPGLLGILLTRLFVVPELLIKLNYQTIKLASKEWLEMLMSLIFLISLIF